MMKGFLVLLFVAMAVVPSFSQQVQIPICGNAQDQSEFLSRLNENKIVMEALRAAANDRGGDIRYVPIHFHLVGDPSGNGKHKESKVLDQLCKLNVAYFPVGIQFYLSAHPTQGLFDKSINHNGVYLDQTNELTMQLRRHANAVNIYVVQEPVPPASNNPPGSIIQAYYNPSKDWIVARKSETNGNEPNVTIPHEMGHLLSLPHTFYGYESNSFDGPSDAGWPIAPVLAPNGGGVTTERVNGTNCNTSADRICDTPPDFNNGYGWSNSCPTYNGGAKDPLGVLITPMQNNFMSYFNGCSNYHFTQDQIDIMNADLSDVSRNYLDNTFVPFATDITTPTDLLVSPANADTLEYYNNAFFEWQAVTGATHYLLEVDITSSFSTNFAQTFIETGTSKLLTNLAANKGYYWRVRPFNYLVSCAVPRLRSFRTPPISATVEIQGLAAWQLSPNPVSGQTANLNIVADQSFEATVRITDAAGRTLFQQSNVEFPQGETIYQLNTAGLANGLYFVSLESGTGRNVRKMSVLR